MTYSIIGTGEVGSALASFFVKAGIKVGVANSRGVDAAKSVASKLGESVVAKSLADAVKADVIFIAVPFEKFGDVAAALPDCAGKTVVDVTNASTTPAEAQEASGHMSSEVNAERVPGAKLVKAFNQLPVKDLTRRVPDGGKRVIFVSSDHADASAKVARLTEELGFVPIEVGKLGEGGRLIQAPNALTFQNLIEFEKK